MQGKDVPTMDLTLPLPQSPMAGALYSTREDNIHSPNDQYYATRDSWMTAYLQCYS
jgi:hypothetical protein